MSNLKDQQKRARSTDLTLRFYWSGKRDSNPRPSAWEADTLPLSYSRESSMIIFKTKKQSKNRFNGLTETVHITRRHTGDIDSAGANNIDRVFLTQLINLILGQAGEAEHTALINDR